MFVIAQRVYWTEWELAQDKGGSVYVPSITHSLKWTYSPLGRRSYKTKAAAKAAAASKKLNPKLWIPVELEQVKQEGVV